MTAAPDRLTALIEPAVEALGYELVGIEFVARGHHGLLRLYIDNEDGITLDDCEKVSHQVSGVLDVEDPIPGQYSLEVSSPGLDRPLFKAAHYERFAGHEVKLQSNAPVDGRRRFKGILQGIRDNEVVIEVDGKEVRLPLESIEKARLVPDV